MGLASKLAAQAQENQPGGPPTASFSKTNSLSAYGGIRSGGQPAFTYTTATQQQRTTNPYGQPPIASAPAQYRPTPQGQPPIPTGPVPSNVQALWDREQQEWEMFNAWRSGAIAFNEASKRRDGDRLLKLEKLHLQEKLKRRDDRVAARAIAEYLAEKENAQTLEGNDKPSETAEQRGRATIEAVFTKGKSVKDGAPKPPEAPLPPKFEMWASGTDRYGASSIRIPMEESVISAQLTSNSSRRNRSSSSVIHYLKRGGQQMQKAVSDACESAGKHDVRYTYEVVDVRPTRRKWKSKFLIIPVLKSKRYLFILKGEEAEGWREKVADLVKHDEQPRRYPGIYSSTPQVPPHLRQYIQQQQQQREVWPLPGRLSFDTISITSARSAAANAGESREDEITTMPRPTPESVEERLNVPADQLSIHRDIREPEEVKPPEDSLSQEHESPLSGKTARESDAQEAPPAEHLKAQDGALAAPSPRTVGSPPVVQQISSAS